MNIYDIAEQANVSTATVSKVINGKEGVGEKTRERILKIMHDNDYSPRISNTEVDSIALVYRTSGGKNPLSSPYIMKIIESTTNMLYEYGYFVLLLPYEQLSENKENLRVFCRKRRISGMILINLREDNTEVTGWSSILPIVTIGSHFPGEKIASITANNYKGAYDAVNYLIQLGHRRICAFIPDVKIPDHQERLNGYLAALKDNNIPIDQGYILDYISLSTTDIILWIQRLIQDNQKKPTAAFICDDMEVLKISKMLQIIHVAVPKDLSIVGFDDYETTIYFSPPLTTVRQPLEEFGKEAGRIIHQMITGEDYPSSVQMETKLVVRQSAIPCTEEVSGNV